MAGLRVVPPSGLPARAIERDDAIAALDIILAKNPAIICIIGQNQEEIAAQGVPHCSVVIDGLCEKWIGVDSGGDE